MEADEAEILEPYELSFSDLLFSSRFQSSSSIDQNRCQSISRNVMEALGPAGPGLLCITGVLGSAALLRRKLLPMARKLALLDPDKRKRILKEHHLGSDVPLKNPKRDVSSFAMQLKNELRPNSSQGKQASYSIGSKLDLQEDDELKDLGGASKELGFSMREISNFSQGKQADYSIGSKQALQEDDKFKGIGGASKDLGFSMREISNSSQGKLADYSIGLKMDLEEDDEFKDLGTAFKELGFCMRELGLSIARICDQEIGGGLLDESLLESSAAKGRLIHYHSAADKHIIKEAESRKQSGKVVSSKKVARNAGEQEMDHRNETSLSGNHFNLWQQWHHDYGILTILTDPMFLSSYSNQECTLMSRHSYLQIYHPSKNKFYMVKTPQDSFLVQIGESADILSKGKLRSTLHCVTKPEKLDHISRETFVVFLQPKWNQTFSVSEYTMEHLRSDENPRADIQRLVPPLSSRLRDGMTFAEFAQETTKQYYGGSGLQSNSNR